MLARVRADVSAHHTTSMGCITTCTCTLASLCFPSYLQDTTLGLTIAESKKAYPFIGPMVGFLGVALTGESRRRAQVTLVIATLVALPHCHGHPVLFFAHGAHAATLLTRWSPALHLPLPVAPCRQHHDVQRAVWLAADGGSRPHRPQPSADGGRQHRCRLARPHHQHGFHGGGQRGLRPGRRHDHAHLQARDPIRPRPHRAVWRLELPRGLRLPRLHPHGAVFELRKIAGASQSQLEVQG